MINNLYSTKTLYIVIVYTLCIVITIFHIQWMCNPVRIYGNKWMNEYRSISEWKGVVVISNFDSLEAAPSNLPP